MGNLQKIMTFLEENDCSFEDVEHKTIGEIEIIMIDFITDEEDEIMNK